MVFLFCSIYLIWFDMGLNFKNPFFKQSFKKDGWRIKFLFKNNHTHLSYVQIPEIASIQKKYSFLVFMDNSSRVTSKFISVIQQFNRCSASEGVIHFRICCFLLKFQIFMFMSNCTAIMTTVFYMLHESSIKRVRFLT